MSWSCYVMSWSCHGHVMSCHGHVMIMLWSCHGHVMVVLCSNPHFAQRFRRFMEFHAWHVMVMLGSCYVMSWSCYGLWERLRTVENVQPPLCATFWQHSWRSHMATSWNRLFFERARLDHAWSRSTPTLRNVLATFLERRTWRLRVMLWSCHGHVMSCHGHVMVMLWSCYAPTPTLRNVLEGFWSSTHGMLWSC